MENGGAAPTGCYNCGRPGHWSRDCPSNPSSDPNDTNPKTTPYSFKSGGGGAGTAASKSVSGDKSSEKPKKVPRSRPKLSLEILLSNDGIGYVLRHFPRAFKYHGRGHEVSDLGNVLGLYAEWHSHLIPYYSFNQFVHKVEQVGASKRVKPPTEKMHQIIARTAMFVSKHGGQSEIVLRVKQGKNPSFGFLMPDDHLHPYFRFLVDHQELLQTENDEKAHHEEKISDGGGALSLLGSLYGNGEDDDGAIENSSVPKPDASGNHLKQVHQFLMALKRLKSQN